MKRFLCAAIAALCLTGVTGCTHNDAGDHRTPKHIADNNKNRPFRSGAGDLRITHDAKKRASEEALRKAYVDILRTAQETRPDKRLYQQGAKDAEAYMSAKSALTPEAWRTETESLKSNAPDPQTEKGQEVARENFKEKQPGDPKKLRAPILTALALPCTEKGMMPVRVNRVGYGQGPDFSTFYCKRSETRVIPKSSAVSVDPRSKDGIVIQTKFLQKFYGYQRGTTRLPTQEVQEDVRFYLVPDKEKKDHWLIDGASYQYEYGRSGRFVTPAEHEERRKSYCHKRYKGLEICPDKDPDATEPEEF